MNNISGELTVCTEEGNVIRTVRYNTSQAEKVRSSGDNTTYNLEGATEEAKTQIARWEASDQFIGRRLVIKDSANVAPRS